MVLGDVKVLVIEDVRSMRVQLEELLLTAGFRNIKILENGAEAKEYLQISPCDVVLSDWHMFPVSGIELLEWLRKDPKLKSLPFIMISAEKTQNYVMDAIKAGVDGYLIKPISLDQIYTKIIPLLLKRKVIS
jgi:two-component system chemotaxis response regulator CheY